jgi:hypothetical protein
MSSMALILDEKPTGTPGPTVAGFLIQFVVCHGLQYMAAVLGKQGPGAACRRTSDKFSPLFDVKKTLSEP